MSSDARRDALPPDAAAVGAVLDQLGALRLRLSADLGVVASAVELEEHRIAAEVLDGVRSDLAGFRAAVAASPPPVELPVRPRRRLRSALPAAPALAAAAALVAVLAGVSPGRGPDAAATDPAPDAAAASYAELFRLHERGAPEAALRAAAHGLHAEIARVMAAAVQDPGGAEAALLRLAAEAGRVEDAEQRADLRSVLAESQRLLTGLEEALHAATGVVPTPPATPRPLPLPGPAAPADGSPLLPPPSEVGPQPPAPGDAPPASPSAPTAEPTAKPATPAPTPTSWLPSSPEGASATVMTPRRPPLGG